MARILLAEDDRTSALVATKLLENVGHAVYWVSNGVEALKLLQDNDFEAVVTDWMMPEMDGLDLIRKIHARFDPVPATIMVTCLDSPQARDHALESGADEFVGKPIRSVEFVAAVGRALARHVASATFVNLPAPPHGHGIATAPFPIVVVGANAGGPAALRVLLRSCGPAAADAAWVIAQHGLPELVSGLLPVLARETSMRVLLASDGMPLAPGRVVLAPGGSHVRIAEGGLTLELFQDRDIHHVCPASDPLFRSAAAAAGARCIAVVLTGMGQDGADGATHVRAACGRVFVAEPGLRVASGMAESVMRAGAATDVVPLPSLGPAITQAIESLSVPRPASLLAG